MALKLRHWVMLGALGCLALATAYAPPRSRESRALPIARATPERSWLNRINGALVRARNRLESVELRDSVRRALRQELGRPTVSLELVGTLPRESRALVQAAVERVWTGTQPLPDRRLLVILNTRPERSWGTYVMPRVLDGRTCVVTARLDWSARWLTAPANTDRETNLEPWLRDAIAPCLYYGAFGQPGPAIEAWLSTRWLRPAARVDWNAPPPLTVLQDEPWRYDFLLSNSSLDALACGNGERVRCTAALFNADDHRRTWAPDGVVFRVGWRNLPFEEHLLATLVREMGRDRFAHFWRSTAPVDAAFQEAFGQSLDRWLVGWSRDFAPDLPPFGPTPRGRAVALSLLMAVVALSAAIGYVVRRQVS